MFDKKLHLLLHMLSEKLSPDRTLQMSGRLGHRLLNTNQLMRQCYDAMALENAPFQDAEYEDTERMFPGPLNLIWNERKH